MKGRVSSVLFTDRGGRAAQPRLSLGANSLFLALLEMNCKGSQRLQGHWKDLRGHFVEGFGKSCLTNLLLLCLTSGRESRKFLPDNFVNWEIKEREGNIKALPTSPGVKSKSNPRAVELQTSPLHS